MRKSLIIILLLLVGCAQQKDRLSAGQQAIDFTAVDVNGQTVRLSDHWDKVVLIHFWADWCAECRAEFPRLQEAYREYRERNLEILAINVGQTIDHVEDFKEEFDLTFPMLLDEETRIAEQYGIRGLPTNFFLRPGGEIEKIIIGWVTEKQIKQVLNQMESD